MEEDIFKYPDTNSSRAKIDYLNRKFKSQRIAIIGLGGTGSYILDLVSKTHVSEIHIYDGDVFQLHNAFRAPGAPSGEKFDETENLMKVNYFDEIYSRMRNGIVPHSEYVTKDNISQLAGFNYVFICVDNNEVRCMIISELQALKISFIDVGLGVKMVNDSLYGSLRVTTGTELKQDHLSARVGSEDLKENEYSTNIQIAELNCLNATLAVIKWKKMCGFYQDLKEEHNTLFLISTNRILNEDHPAQIR